jgi:hypothetical protein
MVRLVLTVVLIFALSGYVRVTAGGLTPGLSIVTSALFLRFRGTSVTSLTPLGRELTLTSVTTTTAESNTTSTNVRAFIRTNASPKLGKKKHFGFWLCALLDGEPK